MDSIDPSARPGQGSPPVTPLLRAVLVCDIVESTALVERLGDVRAVALLKQHDQLLRQAMKLCHGQLVDKADGVLALFERPIQALDFALRYQRGLREIGAVEGLDLKARIGIHVGDVMTWANDPKDVLAGSKPFEVEGLAKPVAARLMGLALPGQILMSGMAQNLCHRAVGELGEEGKRLRWLMHGRYRFKGVPAPMLVHEVGEPGLAPLRAPGSGAKAWRELPLWRRPPVVALEALLVAVFVAAISWSTLRSPPAIAFAERDWVVVADFQNRTDEPLFDDALDTALRIGLEQSRYVNLVSELQIERALERMQRQGQAVDRQLASELALREGAKAVILPTVAEVGGVVRVSLEVIDPNSGVTVYSESADARGIAKVLPALDVAMASTRGRLGEALASVENSSRPLEAVTTGNLEALRAYSMGLQARYESRLPEARSLFEEAVRLDPGFAMAELRLAFLCYTESDAEGTRRHLDLAIAHRDRLSQRESLFLDGAEATLEDPARALEKFKLLTTLYPDEFRGYYNYAFFAHQDLLLDEEALAMIGPALAPQNPARANALYYMGKLQLALGRTQEAIASFERSDAMGVRGFRRDIAEAHAVGRDYARADRIAREQEATGAAGQDLMMRLTDASLPLDRGRFDEALAALRRLQSDAAKEGVSPLIRDALAVADLSLRSQVPDPAFAADLAAFADRQPERFAQADSLARRHVVFDALAAGWLAANTGQPAVARKMLDLTRGDALLENYPANAAMARAVQAELAIQSGQPGEAIRLLAPDHAPGRGLAHSRAVLMRAYEAAGDLGQAQAMAQWLAEHRGLAFAESTGQDAWQLMNLLQSNLALDAAARLAEAAGHPSLAADWRKQFAAAWPDAEDRDRFRRRGDAR